MIKFIIFALFTKQAILQSEQRIISTKEREQQKQNLIEEANDKIRLMLSQSNLSRIIDANNNKSSNTTLNSPQETLKTFQQVFLQQQTPLKVKNIDKNILIKEQSQNKSLQNQEYLENLNNIILMQIPSDFFILQNTSNDNSSKETKLSTLKQLFISDLIDNSQNSEQTIQDIDPEIDALLINSKDEVKNLQSKLDLDNIRIDFNKKIQQQLEDIQQKQSDALLNKIKINQKSQP